MEKADKRKTRAFFIAAAIGLLFTVAGWTLSLVTVSVIPQGQGPSATGLIGGGEAEQGGVTLQIGSYTIVSGVPQYAGTPSGEVQATCRIASGIVDKQSTEDTVVLIVEPVGVAKCLADGQGFKADSGRLSIQLEDVGAVQAKYRNPGASTYLPLSKISAQVNQSTSQRNVEIAALILISAGPGLVIGALIPALQGRRSATS